MKKNSLLLLLLLSALIQSSLLHAAPIRVDESFKEKEIDTHLEYLEDKDARYTIENISQMDNDSIQWKKSPGDGLSFGYTESIYWVRFTIENTSKNNIRFFLQDEYTMMIQQLKQEPT